MLFGLKDFLIDPRDSNKLWQMISKNTNYSNRCKIESLGIKIDEEIEKINEFFTNVAPDPDYDIKNIRNIVESNLGVPTTQNLITISEFEVFMSLSQLSKDDTRCGAWIIYAIV